MDETISLLDRLVLHFANLNSDSSSNASLIQQSDIVFICKHTEAFRKHIRRRLDAKIMQCAAMKAVNLPPTTIHADDSLSSADYDETSVLALHEKLRRVFELLLFYLKV